MSLFRKKFKYYRQLDAMDCGPACLRMVAAYHGVHLQLDTLRNNSGMDREGVSMLGISDAAEKIGMQTRAVQVTFKQLISGVPLPCIIHWNQNHFVVLTPASTGRKLVIGDPGTGELVYQPREFLEHWGDLQSEEGEPVGTALMLEPGPGFYEQEQDPVTAEKSSWSLMTHYLKQHRRYFIQVMNCLLVISGLQLVLPFLMQSVIDKGVSNSNINFVTLILVAQFVLLSSKTVVEFIRGRLLLYISTHVNISLLSSFWHKLLGLPVSFHDIKMTGDIIQRVGDHRRIENFLTGSAITVLYSAISVIIFVFVLAIYNIQIFSIYVAGSLLYFGWILFFLKHRRKLDYKRFEAASKENSATMQLIHAIQDIKLNNAEQLRRNEWERLQTNVFKFSFSNLSINQIQQTGAFFLNDGKNILITFFAAKAVIEGQLSLGAMIAIQYIIGQLNSPIEQLIGFSQQAQEARISLERLNDIQRLEDEEPTGKSFLRQLPADKSITISNLSFTYPGAGQEPVLRDINLSIPEGKTTAIVGTSGSGKTTLLKLLLHFYPRYTGDIHVGNSNLQYMSPSEWRRNCGVVMQDGYIYNDTIARNIAVNTEHPDFDKLLHACRVANILPFIKSQPLGFDMKIGQEGVGISQGQRQRLLIARAVYKDPSYIFLDEATNALDANNEQTIIGNLNTFFTNRTVVVVAHRLSTVKDADNIIVLENGEIIEQGDHASLIGLRGKYYQLVKNQLELEK
jgi:ATP-binding cassette subfamily B protein